MTDRKHKRSDADSDSLTLPVLPLRDVVVFPHMVIPLFVGREKSITALELSDAHDKRIFLAAQKDAGMDDPKSEDIYTAGTIAHVLQMLKLPDGTVKVLVEGISRASVTEWSQPDGCFMAKLAIPQAAEVDPKEDTVLQRSVLEQFEQFVRGSKKIPPEALTALAEINDSSRLADTIAAHLPVRLPKKQELLEIVDVVPRLEHLLHLLETEIDLLQVEKRMRGRVKRQMEKSQREYYLNEQMRAIQKELGELEDGSNDLDELERRIEAAGPPKAVLAKARSELAKLRTMSPMAAEATVVRNYLDWIVQLPWRARSRVRRDLDQAQQVLERDHYGLEKVKERILEYLAVQQRVRKLKGPILCLVGPPGVGKTSSAARSPTQPDASSPACRSAAYATRPKSAATGAPTSVPCRARCYRTWPRSAPAIRCSCSTKSTRWPWIFGAIRPRRCSKCWTRNRTMPSTTIIWRSITTCRTCCSWPPPTRSTSRHRCWTGWK